uniref:uncharacterized protein LOC127067928 n=1 Tax=Vespula vulgaris TaxID=7454 RepID=UPI0021343067|nr:uncharacterized protein LOC127067928 [Vespula vulgaris]
MLKKILIRVRWRILLLCGIGLWIALCANDLYYNNELILSEDKVFPTTRTTAQENTIKKRSTLMSISHFIEQSHKSWGTIRKSRVLTTFVVIFVSIWFILFTTCFENYIRRKSEKFINTPDNKKKLNTNSSKKTLTNVGVQVPIYPFYYTLSSFSTNSTILHRESTTRFESNDTWSSTTQSNQEWFSIMKSSSNILSYSFEENQNEQKIISKDLKKHRDIICNNNNNAYDPHKFAYSYNEFDVFQCEHVSQLIYYINLSRSLHFQSTLFSQRYTVSIFNTFTSLSTKYMLNSSWSVKYLYKQNGVFNDNGERTINSNKLKMANFWSKRKEKICIISSSPEFQQFLANFKNFRYTPQSLYSLKICQ